MTPQEAEREFKRAKKAKEQKFQEKSRKLMLDKFEKLSQGYSYRKAIGEAKPFSHEELNKHLERSER
jgi:hypothetical protein